MEKPDIKYDANGLIPAVAQDSDTGEVLMLAFMNKEALEKTLDTGLAHYYSRSRQKLWMKGETSGNTQKVEGVFYDCDSDSVLLRIKQKGVACHTGERSCFFRRLDQGGKEFGVQKGSAAPASGSEAVISGLYKVLLDRKNSSPDESYVASLYSKGFNKIAAKIHEESAELVHAGKKGGKDEIVHEISDLWFHTMVLLGYKDIAIEDVFTELKRRFGTSGHDEKASRPIKKDED
ncbi:MAG: bifunctional phosphoribosyl-AMP cyclohydrolase/phosphoribosyl-ATP diphosphatase HisIE [Deltaproteobacteria bacterium]|nr:bifunctional phosphoribosyl-AMP cyclohydrolase/phosphoribosyl-ATP diphosphatase HisIE [Deltaproteobacteria bacterium]